MRWFHFRFRFTMFESIDSKAVIVIGLPASSNDILSSPTTTIGFCSLMTKYLSHSTRACEIKMIFYLNKVFLIHDFNIRYNKRYKIFLLYDLKYDFMRFGIVIIMSKTLKKLVLSTMCKFTYTPTIRYKMNIYQ